MKTQARLKAEIKALEFVQNKIGLDWNDLSDVMKLAYIKNQDARVLTQMETEQLRSVA